MTYEKIKEGLEDWGYDAVICDAGVVTTIDVDGSEFPVNISLNERGDEVEFDCAFASIGDFVQEDDVEQSAVSAWWLLAQNTKIQPFAIGALDTEDGIDATDPVVLVDSRSVEQCILYDVMGDLRRALKFLLPHMG